MPVSTRSMLSPTATETPALPDASADIAKQPPVVGQEQATEQATSPEGTGLDATQGTTQAATQSATTEQKYTLVRGDNYWDLAEKFYGDGAAWKKISEANAGLRPRALPIGREITVPAK